MDFRHLIVTCLFSMLRLSFEAQKIKENYAIFILKTGSFVLSFLYGATSSRISASITEYANTKRKLRRHQYSIRMS